MINCVAYIAGRNIRSFQFIQLDLDVVTDSLKEAHAFAMSWKQRSKKGCHSSSGWSYIWSNG